MIKNSLLLDIYSSYLISKYYYLTLICNTYKYVKYKLISLI